MPALRKMSRLYPRLPLPPTWKPRGNNLVHLFTPKELNVLDGVVCGQTNRQIGATIANTEHVIKNIVHRIFNKAGVDSRLELALWWIEHGYVTVEECERSMNDAEKNLHRDSKVHHNRGAWELSSIAAKESKRNGGTSPPALASGNLSDSSTR